MYSGSAATHQADDASELSSMGGQPARAGGGRYGGREANGMGGPGGDGRAGRAAAGVSGEHWRAGAGRYRGGGVNSGDGGQLGRAVGSRGTPWDGRESVRIQAVDSRACTGIKFSKYF